MPVHNELQRGVVRLPGLVAALVGACLAVVTAGCTPDLRSTEFACTEQAECAPMGRICQQGWCVLPDIVLPDAGGPSDAPGQTPDAPNCTPASVDAQASASVENDTRVAWTHTVGDMADRLLVVGIAYRNASAAAADVERVRVGDTDLTLVHGEGLASAVRTELWALNNPLSGAETMEVRFTAGVNVIAGSISLFSVDQATPLGTPAGMPGASGNPRVSVTSAPCDVAVASVGVLGSNTGLGVGTGQTQQWNLSVGNGGNSLTGAGSTESGAASVVMDWILGGGNSTWAIAAVSVRATP